MSLAFDSRWAYPDSTGGRSQLAFQLMEKLGDFHKRKSESFSFDDGRNAVLEALIETRNNCSKPNWDGYGASQIAEITFLNACTFVEKLPKNVPMPEVGAEPDGHLVLEWYKSPRWIFSLSIAPDSTLYYAYLFGEKSDHGKEIFFGKTSDKITNLINEWSDDSK